MLLLFPPPQKTIEKKKERNKPVKFTDDQKIVPRPENVNEIISNFQHIEGTRYKDPNGIRSLARTDEIVIHQYDVIDGIIYPALDSKTIPPPSEREIGQIYLTSKNNVGGEGNIIGKKWMLEDGQTLPVVPIHEKERSFYSLLPSLHRRT